MKLSCLLCFGLTLAFISTHHNAWLWLASMLGLASSPFVITMASTIARAVPLDERGRVLSFAMVIANIIFYIHTAFGPFLRPSLVAPTSAGWLLIPLVILHFNLRPSCVREWRYSGAYGEERGHGVRDFPLHLAILIVSFYVIAGFAYQVIFPSLASVHNLDRYYNALPYIFVSILGGQISDSVGRRPLAYAGFINLGVATAIFPLMKGASGYFITQTLIQGAYACIDLFIWVTLADIAPRDRASWYYGVGLGLNVLAIFIGMFLIRLFLHMPQMDLEETCLAASIIMFLGVLGLAGLKETLQGQLSIGEKVQFPITNVGDDNSCLIPNAGNQSSITPDIDAVSTIAAETWGKRRGEGIDILTEDVRSTYDAARKYADSHPSIDLTVGGSLIGENYGAGLQEGANADEVENSVPSTINPAVAPAKAIVQDLRDAGLTVKGTYEEQIKLQKENIEQKVAPYLTAVGDYLQAIHPYALNCNLFTLEPGEYTEEKVYTTYAANPEGAYKTGTWKVTMEKGLVKGLVGE